MDFKGVATRQNDTPFFVIRVVGSDACIAKGPVEPWLFAMQASLPTEYQGILCVFRGSQGLVIHCAQSFQSMRNTEGLFIPLLWHFLQFIQVVAPVAGDVFQFGVGGVAEMRLAGHDPEVIAFFTADDGGLVVLIHI